MRMAMAVLAAGLLVLAGCGGDAPPPAASGRDARAELKTMAPGARNAVFIRAIRDADHPCQQVTRSAYQRESGTQSLWAATCGGEGVWAVLVSRDGDAAVAACDAVAGDGRAMCAVPPQ